ncbi:DUF309 domain-containing protein [Cohnella sp. WQ 127256]|uniref:DUF309 domain-containing protein n=1 Tax=Cohnella sp. WQ 127256 TaxID=2938790 RepID=UPI002118FCB4|nr:DUF309 domain-containing protein [Cohnella sp. WQ 127256]
MQKTIDYPDEYIQYLVEYNGSRDYFECHEIMEEYWKEHPDSEYKTCWLVLIRISVCMYHSRRGNWAGAIKLMGKAAEEAEAHQFDKLGLDGTKLVELMRQAALDWTQPNRTYVDLQLPIIDHKLQDAARQRCNELGYIWGIHGQEAGDPIIHRHLTRDRSDVVLERAESAKRKAFSRQVPNEDNRL